MQAATIEAQKAAIDVHELKMVKYDATIASHATTLTDLLEKVAILVVEASATTTTRTTVSLTAKPSEIQRMAKEKERSVSELCLLTTINSKGGQNKHQPTQPTPNQTTASVLLT